MLWLSCFRAFILFQLLCSQVYAANLSVCKTFKDLFSVPGLGNAGHSYTDDYVGNVYFMLAVSHHNKAFLAIAPYLILDAHRKIFQTIEPIAEEAGNIHFVAAAGELHRGPNGFDRGNETSLFTLEKLPKSVENRNDIEEFDRFMRAKKSTYIAPNFEKLSFKDSGPNLHLDVRLNDKDSFLSTTHEANNDLSTLLTSLGVLSLMSNQGIEIDFGAPTVKKLRGRIHKKRDALVRYLELFHPNDAKLPTIAEIQRRLADLANSETFPVEYYFELGAVLKVIDAGLKNPTIEVIPMGDWIPK